MTILVGGHPFDVVPYLWRRSGADGYAADARGAAGRGREATGRPAGPRARRHASPGRPPVRISAIANVPGAAETAGRRSEESEAPAV